MITQEEPNFVKRTVTYAILTLLLASICIPGVVKAQEQPQGLAISPPTFELSANPGDTTKNSIRVDNLTTIPVHVTTALKNFTALGEEGQVGLSDEESGFSLASWITIDKSDATIDAKASQVFTFTIKVPANAEPGGRFGSIIFKTDAQPTAGGGLSISQELGALLLLRVAGESTERGHIEEFKVLRDFYEYGPVQFETRLKNEGNVHIRPTGTITIADFFGNKVATIALDSKNVLPGAIRKLENNWSEHTLFGKYTATMSLQYGANQQMVTASTTFVVIPWRLLLVWLAALAVVAFLLYRGRTRIIRAFRILFDKE
jgi:hypothetical protein